METTLARTYLGRDVTFVCRRITIGNSAVDDRPGRDFIDDFEVADLQSDDDGLPLTAAETKEMTDMIHDDDDVRDELMIEYGEYKQARQDDRDEDR